MPDCFGWLWALGVQASLLLQTILGLVASPPRAMHGTRHSNATCYPSSLRWFFLDVLCVRVTTRLKGFTRVHLCVIDRGSRFGGLMFEKKTVRQRLRSLPQSVRSRPPCLPLDCSHKRDGRIAARVSLLGRLCQRETHWAGSYFCIIHWLSRLNLRAIPRQNFSLVAATHTDFTAWEWF